MSFTKLFHDDCFNVLEKVARDGKKVDMFLCDVPYGCTKNLWDEKLDLSKLFGWFEKISKNTTPIVFFADGIFASEVSMLKKEMYRYKWIWKKNIATGFLNARKRPLDDFEEILVFYKFPPVYNPQFVEGKPYVKKSPIGEKSSTNYNQLKKEIICVNSGFRYPKMILEFDCERGPHPTQKPVPLLEYLIKTYTNENGIVLDPCMGSGSTGVACKNLNRSFVGVEKNIHYFEIAKTRILWRK